MATYGIIDQFRVHIQREWSSGDDRLFVYRDTGRRHESGIGQVVEVANGFTWAEHPEGDAWLVADGISKAETLIQAIMDKAWAAGYRPSGFSDIKNETAAIRAHLADMKAIAFHQLKIK